VKALGLDLGLLLSQAVNFSLLAFLLYLFLYKPVLGKLEERARRIRKGVEEAEHAEERLAQAEAHYNAEMERARQEAREVIERATRAAEQQRQEILSRARQEAQDLAERARQQGERQALEEQAQQREQVIDLAIAVASRLLQENLDQEKQHRLVEQFLVEAERMR